MRSRKRVSALVALAAGIVAALATTPSAFGWTVDMTAQTSLKRTYQWKIEKSVTPTSVTLNAGETATVAYSVTVTNTGSTDSDWAVGGNVTLLERPEHHDRRPSGVLDAARSERPAEPRHGDEL